MRRFFTLTLLTALILTAGNSPSAQQRAANPVRQEAKAEVSERDAADEDFARACQEASKLTGRLGADRKFADKFIEAARAQDRAKTEALAKEAGVRGDLKVDAGREGPADQASRITITICWNRTCITIVISRNSAR